MQLKETRLMARYVDPTEQLVVEVFVRDIAVSKTFYQQFGFQLKEDRGDFVVLSWEDHQLFLDERPDRASPPAFPQINIRIMVPDVDAYWARAQATRSPILAAIADREYGLRDFTILDPDGVGLRFGTRLPTPARRNWRPDTPRDGASYGGWVDH